MTKVDIELPEEFDFATSIKIRVTDLNYGNHLANDSVASYLHIARTELLESQGLSELNIGDNISLIQGNLAITFLSEGFLHNDIAIKMAVTEFSKSSFSIYYLLHNTSTNKELAKAFTRLVCFDYNEHKTKPIPSSFRDRFSAQ